MRAALVVLLAAANASAQDVAIGNDPEPPVLLLAAKATRPPSPRCNIAEARFRRAERRVRSALRARIPTSTFDQMVASNARAVVRALEKIVHLVDRATAALRGTIDLGCVPWTIAAARALGELDEHIMAEVARIPVPDTQIAVCGNDALEPIRARAEAHYAFCHATAVAHGWPSDDALRCASGLSRLDSSRYPVPDELVPSREWTP